MKKIIAVYVMGAIMCLFNHSLMAQSTYYTGFDTEGEKANWDEYQKGKTSSAKWEIVTNGVSEPNRLSHSAPTGDANKDSLVNWYVSPKFDFSEGGSIDSLKYNYFSFMGTFLEEQVVQIYVLVGDKDPAQASSKILLADLTSFYSGDQDNWRDTGAFSIPNTSGDCYIAFKFVAIDGWSSISFDNIYITSNKVTSISDVAKNNQSLYLYPNPSAGSLYLADEFGLIDDVNSKLEVFNLQGALVYATPTGFQNKFEIAIPKGTYFYQISNSKGEILSYQKLILKHE